MFLRPSTYDHHSQVEHKIKILHHDQVKHTTKIFLRSNTRPTKIYSQVEHANKKNHSQVDHTTNIFLRRNTRSKIFLRTNSVTTTRDKSLSGRTGTAKIILRSHTRPKTFRLRHLIFPAQVEFLPPNSFSGRKHDQNQIEHIRKFSQV